MNNSGVPSYARFSLSEIGTFSKRANMPLPVVTGYADTVEGPLLLQRINDAAPLQAIDADTPASEAPATKPMGVKVKTEEAIDGIEVAWPWSGSCPLEQTLSKLGHERYLACLAGDWAKVASQDAKIKLHSGLGQDLIDAHDSNYIARPFEKDGKAFFHVRNPDPRAPAPLLVIETDASTKKVLQVWERPGVRWEGNLPMTGWKPVTVLADRTGGPMTADGDIYETLYRKDQSEQDFVGGTFLHPRFGRISPAALDGILQLNLSHWRPEGALSKFRLIHHGPETFNPYPEGPKFPIAAILPQQAGMDFSFALIRNQDELDAFYNDMEKHGFYRLKEKDDADLEKAWQDLREYTSPAAFQETILSQCDKIEDPAQRAWATNLAELYFIDKNENIGSDKGLVEFTTLYVDRYKQLPPSESHRLCDMAMELVRGIYIEGNGQAGNGRTFEQIETCYNMARRIKEDPLASQCMEILGIEEDVKKAYQDYEDYGRDMHTIANAMNYTLA